MHSGAFWEGGERHLFHPTWAQRVEILFVVHCRYVWGGSFLTLNHHNHKNWVPSILTHNLWLISNFFFFFWKNKIQNGRLKKRSFFKIANSQYFFVKISWSGPWVSRIHWCEGHWYGSTYMAMRLSDISSKMAKKHKKCIFGLFLSLCPTASQP